MGAHITGRCTANPAGAQARIDLADGTALLIHVEKAQLGEVVVISSPHGTLVIEPFAANSIRVHVDMS